MISKCDRCDWSGDSQNVKNVFPNIPGLLSRIGPNGVVPSCECPKCGALAYAVKVVPYKITVKQLVEDEELSDADDIEAMALGKDGKYTWSCQAASEEEALDKFHDRVPLGNLEDYEVTAAASKKFTVISFSPNNCNQIVCDHVEAEYGMSAFAVAVGERGTEFEFVVAIEGHLSDDSELTFPGEGVVDGQTITDQPEVFGEVPEQE